MAYRRCTVLEVSAGESLATSEGIQYENFGAGHFRVTSDGTVGTLTWYSSHDGTTYVPAHNSTDAITQSVTKNQSYPIPSDLSGAMWIKVVADVASTLNVVLKT